MKTVKKLLNADGNVRIGNHQVVETQRGRDFIYFETVICSVDDMSRTFTLDNGGYWTSSTAKALTAYRTELRDTHAELITATITRKKRNGLFVAEDQVGKEWELDPLEYGFGEYDFKIYKGLKFNGVIAHNGQVNIKSLVVEVTA